jgi:hypothetical protein
MAENTGLSQSASGAQLARLQHLLLELANRHAITVVVTNTAPHAPACEADDPSGTVAKTALGVTWQSMAHVRLLLQAAEAPPGKPAPGSIRVVKTNTFMVLMGSTIPLECCEPGVYSRDPAPA